MIINEKSYSFRRRIFTNQVILIILVATAVVISLTYIADRYLSQTYRETQIRLYRSVEDALHTELDKMNTLSVNFLYSNLVKDNFREYRERIKSLNEEDPQSVRLVRDKMKVLLNFITSIIGPSRTVSQINLYSLSGIRIGSGSYSFNDSVSLDNYSWFSPVQSLAGKKYITAPWTPYGYSNSVISMLRIFYSSNYEAEGIVEIQQDYSVFFKSLDKLIAENPYLTIYIADSRNHLFYPAETDSKSGDALLALIEEEDLPSTEVIGHTGLLPERELVYWNTLNETGWKLIVAYDTVALSRNLHLLLFFSLCILIAVILLGSLLAYKEAGRLSVPLSSLSDRLSRIDIDNAGIVNTDQNTRNSSIKEINILNNAIEIMSRKIQISLDELLVARAEELNARTLALQQLMSPHFLFNNLTIIATLADEAGNSDLSGFCHDISDLLRYASSTYGEGATIEEELLFIRKYINCMRYQFGDQILYTEDIDSRLLEKRIPRMSLQPIIENSFKYGMSNINDFQLQIKGEYFDTDNWIITVEDNGDGFNPDILQTAKSGITLETLSSRSGTSIGKMGLENVNLRFWLRLGNQMVFERGNRPVGGAYVKMGKSLRRNSNET